FGKAFEPKWYAKVVDACALTADIAILQDGDRTLIGDKGVNLSGGQKARLALARAVYADRDIVLLDDCLSAVDAHVDKHIFANVLGPRGLLRKKSVVLVTHGVHHLAQCDEVALLKDGTIAEHGPFERVMADEGEVFKLVSEFSTTAAKHSSAEADNATKGAIRRPAAGNLVAQDSIVAESLISLGDAPNADHDPPQPTRDDDDSTSGVVDWAVYKAYLAACGRNNFFLFFPLFAIGLGIMSMHSYWLEVMSSAVARAAKQGGAADLVFYLGVYGGLSVANAVAMAALCYVAMVVMSIRASREFHTGLVERVLHAPMSWYDVVPAGRIVNRFSSDVDLLDMQIPLGLVNFMFAAGAILSSLVILGITSPWVLVVIPLGA
ncbi:P-loop containing nucleoside triphosphate hydrolase protein, partial [Blastocladiella britannica]